jgi:hypothetical protein
LAIQNNLVVRLRLGVSERIIERAVCTAAAFNHGLRLSPLETNLHSPQRRLIELQMEHSDLDALIDHHAEHAPVDELMMRRLKKRRLALRDDIARLQSALQPDEPA